MYFRRAVQTTTKLIIFGSLRLSRLTSTAATSAHIRLRVIWNALRLHSSRSRQLPGFRAFLPEPPAGCVCPATGQSALVDGFYDGSRSEEHTSELQSRLHLVCRLLLEKKKRVEHYKIKGDRRQNYIRGD